VRRIVEGGEHLELRRGFVIDGKDLDYEERFTFASTA